MDPHDRLPDGDLDAMLDGSVPPGAVGTPLAAYLAELREDATTATPTANAVLSSVLTDGLAEAEAASQGILTFSSNEAEKGILTGSADKGILTRRGILTASTEKGILTRGILTIRTKGRAISRVLITQFAALGLLSKAAVAGATVSVAAAGAGAVGALPPTVQVAFDDAVGREVEQVEPLDDDADGVEGDAGVDGGDVADLAREDDGEPGVDGRDVADEASDGRAGGTASDGRAGGTASDGRAGGTASDGSAGGTASEDAGSTTGSDRAGESSDGRVATDGPRESPEQAPQD